MQLTEPEGQMLEYEEAWSDAARETLIAFANGLGGVLQIGASGDGEVLGCDFDQVEQCVRHFALEEAEPTIDHLVEVRKQELGGRVLAAVLVAPGERRPYALRGKILTEGGVFVRLGDQTVPASSDEIICLARHGDPRTWEDRPSPETELTFEEAREAYFRFWEDRGLRTNEGAFTNFALLLSDQNPFCLVINMYGAGGMLDGTIRLGGSLLQQWLAAGKRLSEINTPFIRKDSADFVRKEVHPWPPAALREALASVFVHRDYASPLLAAVNVHPDVIGFFTPGGMPPGITPDEAFSEGAGFCRNEKLAEIFMRIQAAQTTGTGLGDIIRAYAGFPQRPVLQHIGRSFRIELPRVNGQQSSREFEALRFLRASANGRSRAELEAFLKVSRPTVLNLLKSLKAAGQVAARGRGPATRYFAV